MFPGSTGGPGGGLCCGAPAYRCVVRGGTWQQECTVEQGTVIGRSRPRRRPSGGGARHRSLRQFSVLWGTTRFEAMAVFVARLLSGAHRRSCSCRVSAKTRTSTSGMSQVRWLTNIVVDWRRRLHQWWRREAKVILLRPRVSRLLAALVVGSWTHGSLSGVHQDWRQSF